MPEKERQSNRRSSRQILFRKIGLPLSALTKRQWQPRAPTRASAPRRRRLQRLRVACEISRLSLPTAIQFLSSLLPDLPCQIPRLAEFSPRDLNSVPPSSFTLPVADFGHRDYVSVTTTDRTPFDLTTGHLSPASSSFHRRDVSPLPEATPEFCAKVCGR